MAVKKPIYEHITSSVADGKLPDDFSLVEYDDSDFIIRMADGAMDGISVYHMSQPTLPEDVVKAIAQSFETACTGDYETADATSIVYAGLSESPVAGIPSLDDPKAELERYVSQAARQKLDLWDCECIDSIADLADEEGWDDLVAKCDALLGTDAVHSLVEDEVTRGRGIGIARQLDMPYKDALLKAMRSDFDKLYSNCHWLMDDPEHLDAVLDLFRESIPLDSIEDDPKDEIGLGKEFKANLQLGYVVLSLRHKLPIGLDFVFKALTAPVVFNRTTAHRVLRCWVSDEGRPLSEVSLEAYDRLRYAYERESREDLREAIKQILDGEFIFSEDKMKEQAMGCEATMGNELENAVRMDRARWSLPSLCAASTTEARRTRIFNAEVGRLNCRFRSGVRWDQALRCRIDCGAAPFQEVIRHG